MTASVTIGVPVFRGELFVEEALNSIQAQTYKDFNVLISIDGPDPACEEICCRFLSDPRFRMVVQPERLGWVGNINWLMSQVKGDYWYYHQQDDITADNYMEALLDHAYANPQAALVYCDMVAFGSYEAEISQPSVTGNAFTRELTLLREQYHAVGFRGLARVDAVRQAGGIPSNDCENFGCDTVWLAAVGLSGELLRLPLPLYRKRYHANSTHLGWSAWPREQAVKAWSLHCVNMVEQAFRMNSTAQERRLLWLAAVERLTSPRTAGYYLRLADLTLDDCTQLLEHFIHGARASKAQDFVSMLEAGWDEIYQWTQSHHSRGVAALPHLQADAESAGTVLVPDQRLDEARGPIAGIAAFRGGLKRRLRSIGWWKPRSRPTTS